MEEEEEEEEKEEKAIVRSAPDGSDNQKNKEHHWSLNLRLDFSFLEVNQQKDSLLPLRCLALTIAPFPPYLRLAMPLDLSSPPPTHHSLQYAGGGGWENQTQQIVSHST